MLIQSSYCFHYLTGVNVLWFASFVLLTSRILTLISDMQKPRLTTLFQNWPGLNMIYKY